MNFREDPAHVAKVAHERGYVAPVLVDRTGDVTGRLYGVWGPPTVYVVDRERAAGRPRAWARGTGHSPAARQLLLALPRRESLTRPAGRPRWAIRASPGDGYAPSTGCSASTWASQSVTSISR